MLVLSRQRDESIIIGDNIVVTIVDIRGDKVRLGINAPTEIPVHRQEIYDAIQRENLPRQPRRAQGHAQPGSGERVAAAEAQSRAIARESHGAAQGVARRLLLNRNADDPAGPSPLVGGTNLGLPTGTSWVWGCAVPRLAAPLNCLRCAVPPASAKDRGRIGRGAALVKLLWPPYDDG